jgi:hypothetical protein
VHARFWWRNLRERKHLEDPGIDVRKILKWIFKKWDWGMDCINLLNAELNPSCKSQLAKIF